MKELEKLFAINPILIRPNRDTKPSHIDDKFLILFSTLDIYE